MLIICSLYLPGEKKKAICKYCRLEMTAKSSHGTMSLWRHIQRCSSSGSKAKQLLLHFNAKTDSSTWVFSQKDSRDLLTKLVISDKKPFTSVKHLIFKAFIASLQPRFKLHSRITLRKDVIDMYKSMKETIANMRLPVSTVLL
jgi:hypothetical protein